MPLYQQATLCDNGVGDKLHALLEKLALIKSANDYEYEPVVYEKPRYKFLNQMPNSIRDHRAKLAQQVLSTW